MIPYGATGTTPYTFYESAVEAATRATRDEFFRWVYRLAENPKYSEQWAMDIGVTKSGLFEAQRQPDPGYHGR